MNKRSNFGCILLYVCIIYIFVNTPTFKSLEYPFNFEQKHVFPIYIYCSEDTHIHSELFNFFNTKLTGAPNFWMAVYHVDTFHFTFRYFNLHFNKWFNNKENGATTISQYFLIPRAGSDSCFMLEYFRLFPDD